MSNDFDSKHLWWLVWLVGAMLVVKITWVVIEWWVPLPVLGVKHEESRVRHSLHYRYRLASDTKIKAPVKSTQSSARKPSAVAPLSSYRLVAVYSKTDYAVVTLIHGAKSFVLSNGANGGDVEGYHLKDANATTARFQKEDILVTLKLFEKKIPATAISDTAVSSELTEERKKETTKSPQE